MKKLFMLFMLLIIAIPTFASDGSQIESVFLSFAALVAVIPLIVESVKSFLKPKNKLFIQIISWLTGIAVTMLGWWFSLGFLDGLLWWNALIVGAFASLAANGVYDTGVYEWVLKLLGIIKK